MHIWADLTLVVEFLGCLDRNRVAILVEAGLPIAVASKAVLVPPASLPGFHLKVKKETLTPDLMLKLL